MTFRIDKRVASDIHIESSAKQVSLNNLVNSILVRYVQWDRFESKVGMVPISKELIKSLFDYLKEEQVIDFKIHG
jgi:hypothetical protein